MNFFSWRRSNDDIWGITIDTFRDKLESLETEFVVYVLSLMHLCHWNWFLCLLCFHNDLFFRTIEVRSSTFEEVVLVN